MVQEGLHLVKPDVLFTGCRDNRGREWRGKGSGESRKRGGKDVRA